MCFHVGEVEQVLCQWLNGAIRHLSDLNFQQKVKMPIFAEQKAILRCFDYMNTAHIFDKALALEPISHEEAKYLYEHATLPEMMHVANEIRLIKKAHSPGIVTWQIDRNVNTTNVCVANCKFCNFFRPPGHPDTYITDDDSYRRKIEEMFALGGDQLLLQGGHHPQLGITWYEELFSKLKSWYPELKLHALGPPEVVHISEISGLTYYETLQRLQAAGMDSIPLSLIHI